MKFSHGAKDGSVWKKNAQRFEASKSYYNFDKYPIETTILKRELFKHMYIGTCGVVLFKRSEKMSLIFLLKEKYQRFHVRSG